MNRREIFKWIAGIGATTLLPAMRTATASAAQVGISTLDGDRLYDHLVRYTQLGEHRTGTTGDLLTAQWIHDEFSSYGLKADLHPVRMNLFEVTAGFLEINHQRFRADPEWYPTATPHEGVRAPMRVKREDEAFSVLRGKIWVVPVQMERPVVPREIKEQALEAAKAGAVGVVMLLTFRSDELTGRGAHGQWGQKPWCPVPLVGVAGKHAEVLDAARGGATARLVVQGREQLGHHAMNVTGTIGQGEKLIVVTTPHSGLFRCGGERGGGIAILLGLAEWVCQRNPAVRYLFATNTGHEQDGSGAEYLVEHVVPAPDEVTAWLHLGSGVATWDWHKREDGTFERASKQSGVRNFGSVPKFIPLLTRAFEPVPGLIPQSERMAGELRAYVRAGYPAFGFWGYNHYGHTVADGPEQSAPALLEPVARCLAEALIAIEQGQTT
ncbi:MAG: hypothetical protein ACFHX7_23830 [Pseudomonadota bacterium]